jgi:hypothetical protein
MKQEGFLISEELKLIIRAVQKNYFEEVCNWIAVSLSFSSCSYLHQLFFLYLEAYLMILSHLSIKYLRPILTDNLWLIILLYFDC